MNDAQEELERAHTALRKRAGDLGPEMGEHLLRSAAHSLTAIAMIVGPDPVARPGRTPQATATTARCPHCHRRINIFVS
jgi:hypothetical protein